MPAKPRWIGASGPQRPIASCQHLGREQGVGDGVGHHGVREKASTIENNAAVIGRSVGRFGRRTVTFLLRRLVASMQRGAWLADAIAYL